MIITKGLGSKLLITKGYGETIIERIGEFIKIIHKEFKELFIFKIKVKTIC